jgi:predicted transcriptional regulator
VIARNSPDSSSYLVLRERNWIDLGEAKRIEKGRNPHLFPKAVSQSTQMD